MVLTSLNYATLQVSLHEMEAGCEVLRADLAAACKEKGEKVEQVARAEDVCRRHEAHLREVQGVVDGQLVELQVTSRVNSV